MELETAWAFPACYVGPSMTQTILFLCVLVISLPQNPIQSDSSSPLYHSYPRLLPLLIRPNSPALDTFVHHHQL